MNNQVLKIKIRSSVREIEKKWRKDEKQIKVTVVLCEIILEGDPKF